MLIGTLTEELAIQYQEWFLEVNGWWPREDELTRARRYDHHSRDARFAYDFFFGDPDAEEA